MKLDLTHPTIARLAELQGDQPDRPFARRWLSVSDTTWLRLKNGTYTAVDQSSALAKITSDLRKLEDHITITTGAGQDLLPMEHIEVSLAAVKSAFGQVRNRLVIILAPTGGGKTSSAQAIAAEYPGASSTVQSSETWRKSYMAAMQDIADGCGLGVLENSVRKAEKTLMGHLKANPKIIIIDEGNYFGAATLNLVKLILNVTGSTVVILALPEFWDKIVRTSREEAQQLRNRTAAKVSLNKVDYEGARMMMRANAGPGWAKLSAADEKQVLLRVVAEAKSFGLWNTVMSIANEVRLETNGDAATTAIVDRAISNVRALRN